MADDVESNGSVMLTLDDHGPVGEDCAALSDWESFVDVGCGTPFPFVCELHQEEVEYTCHTDQEWHAVPRKEYSAHTCYCKQHGAELKDKWMKLPLL